MNIPFLIVLIIMLLLAGLLVILMLLYRKIRSYEQQNQEREKLFKTLEFKLHTIELENIKHKLNPHLFKNVLNSIQSHAYQTYYALDKLAHVLDYILYESEDRFVSLKDELNFALNLIEINRLKVSPLFDLRIKNTIPDDEPLLQEKLVAPMVTVDLIENAFKHADLQKPDAFISIVFELRDGIFFLTVSNKISPRPSLKKTNSGVGRTNFKRRLDILYKDCYQLDEFIEQDVYIAHLKIRLLEHKTQMLTAR